MAGDASDAILNESVLAQLQSAANAAEPTHSLPSTDKNDTARNDDGDGDGALEQQSSAPSRPSARTTSPSQAQQNMRGDSIKDLDESITIPPQQAIRALRKYTTLTNQEIFRRVGISNSGGYRYLRGDDVREKETRGRKRKLDDTVLDKIIHEIESQPVGEKTKSWDELSKVAGADGVVASPITLKRAVEGAGYYKCTHCQRVTKAHGIHSAGLKAKMDNPRTPG